MASAFARLVAISAGQPPGRSPPRNVSASGTQRYGVGSSVPPQSNSRRKRERSVRGELAPWLMTSGRTCACWSRRTQSMAAPFGAHTHLWKLPV